MTPRRTLGRKLLFALIVTGLALLLFEGVLTALGVKPVYYDDPFVGFVAGSPLFHEVTLDDGRVVYQTAPGKLRWFNEQSFPRAKGRNTYRIFCLGGSTTVGRPYDDRTSFAGWLREFLAEADPTRTWEVINAGGVSYASYRVARLMEELVEYEPDLFIVYTGHNEFLERHTYGDLQDIPAPLRDVGALLSHSRIFSATHRLLNPPAAGGDSRTETGGSVLPAEVDAVLDRTVGPESYIRDDAFQSHVISHFAMTLQRIVEMAQDAGADVLLVEPASNLRDCRPFKSQHRAGLTDDQLHAWQQLVNQAEAAVRTQQWEDGRELFEQAIAIDDRVAELHYERARVLWELQRFDDAAAAFARARDEDICPLRALTAMRETVRDVAEGHGVRLIPFATEVASRAPHGVPGAEMFLDHVHPTIAGHQLLADLILEELAEMDVFEPSPSWDETTRTTLIETVQSRLNLHDHAVALRNLAKVLTWAGKFEEADRLALQAVKDLPDDYDAHFLAGNAAARRQDYQAAIAYFETTTRLNPNYTKAYNNLGDAYFQSGELEQAAEQFEQATRIDPEFATAYHNLGVVHLASGNADQALDFLHAALKLEPDRYDTHFNLSKLHYREGRYNEARRHLEIMVSLRPDDPAPRRDLEELRKLDQ